MSQKPPSSPKTLVVDGLNVCRSFDRNQPTSLAVLLTLLIALHKRGDKFICVFDATARHRIREAGGDAAETVFSGLAAALRDRFVQAPAGTRADDFILSYAHSKQLSVISNDRFAEYAVTYPWLTQDRSRRITGVVIDGEVSVPALNISARLHRDAAAAAQELIRLRSQPTLPAKPPQPPAKKPQPASKPKPPAKQRQQPAQQPKQGTKKPQQAANMPKPPAQERQPTPKPKRQQKRGATPKAPPQKPSIWQRIFGQ